MVKEVSGPGPFCFPDSLVKIPNRCITRLALGGCNTGEGGLTVNVPPMEAPEVRCVATLEKPARDRVDVHV